MPGGPNDLLMLGSSSSMPTRARNHVGMMLRLAGSTVLIDPGEGTQRQILLANRSVTTIDAICLTHLHGDHCLGLPGVLQRRAHERPDVVVELLYPHASSDALHHLLHAGLTATPPAVHLVPVQASGAAAVVGEVTIEAMPLDHPVPTFGWRFVTAPSRNFIPQALAEAGISGPDVGILAREGAVVVRGRRVHLEDVSLVRPGLVVAVVLDTRWCENAIALARDADLVVCESTFRAGEESMADAYGHLTSTQAATIARDAGARQLVLTHYSGRHPDEREFATEAAAVFADVIAAADFTVVPIGRATDRGAAGRPPGGSGGDRRSTGSQ